MQPETQQSHVMTFRGLLPQRDLPFLHFLPWLSAGKRPFPIFVLPLLLLGMHPDNLPKTVTDCLKQDHEERKAAIRESCTTHAATAGGKATKIGKAAQTKVDKNNQRWQRHPRERERRHMLPLMAHQGSQKGAHELTKGQGINGRAEQESQSDP